MDEYGATAASRMIADPALAARTAGRMLELRLTAGEQTRAALSQVDVTDPAYGELAQAVAFGDAHRRGAADAAYLVELLGQALEGDCDRLYQVAFALREAEQAAVERARSAGGQR